MRACIEAIDLLAAPADPSLILRALRDLSVKVDVYLKPDAVVASVQVLTDMLGGYPADVSLDAVRSWPKTERGDRWPTDKGLTAECEARMALRTKLRDRFAASIDDAPTAASASKSGPVGNALMFVHECRKRLGDGWVESWLERACVFRGDEIRTGSWYADRIRRDARKELEAHPEVQIVVDEGALKLARAGAA